MLYLLGFLRAPALAAAGAASRALYVFAHHSDLWRALVLGACAALAPQAAGQHHHLVGRGCA